MGPKLRDRVEMHETHIDGAVIRTWRYEGFRDFGWYFSMTIGKDDVDFGNGFETRSKAIEFARKQAEWWKGDF